MRHDEIKVELAEESLPVAFVKGHSSLNSLTKRLAESIETQIPATGATFSPHRLSATAIFYALVTSPFLVLGPALGFSVNPLLFLLTIVPVIVFLYPHLKVRTMIGDRRRATERELPLFAVHASTLQSANCDMFDSLRSITESRAGKEIFRQLVSDARLAQRDERFFQKSPLEAIESLGRNNPSEEMKTLLLGYTSEARSGGDMTGYLENKTEEHLDRAESKWHRYLQTVGTIGELFIAVLFLIPVSLLMMIYLAPEESITIFQASLAILFPLVVVLGVLIVRTAQPKNYNLIRGNHWAALVAGMMVLGGTWFTDLPVWVVLILGLGTATGTYGIGTAVQRREITAHEKALPRFLRDATEYHKLGYPLEKAIIKVSKENTYNREFDSMLGGVVNQLKSGDTLGDVHADTGSWHTRAGFFHLGEVAKTGGYSAKSLEMLTQYFSRVIGMKYRTRSSMRLYTILALATPIALGIIVGLFSGFLTGMSEGSVQAGAEVPGAISGMMGGVPPIVAGLSKGLIIVASASIALLMSYAVDFTLKNTGWVTLNLLLAGVGIWLMDLVSRTSAGIF